MPMTLVKPRLMRWNSNAISDHNRQPVQITVEPIEKSTRMANGTLRKFYVADKHSFAVSWELLPKASNKTVDGFYGGSSIESFYNSNTGSFPLELTDADGTVTTYTVMFDRTSWSKEIVYRGTTGVDLWNISVTMIEV